MDNSDKNPSTKDLYVKTLCEISDALKFKETIFGEIKIVDLKSVDWRKFNGNQT